MQHEGTPKRGHDPSLPRTKECEHCGRTFSRDERKHGYSNSLWIAKRFCGNKCGRAAKAAYLRGLSVEEHPGFKGEDITLETGRGRARRLYAPVSSCERCGHTPAEGEWPIERHHRNENPRDNRPENIEMLCRGCHRRHHVALRKAA